MQETNFGETTLPTKKIRDSSLVAPLLLRHLVQENKVWLKIVPRRAISVERYIASKLAEHDVADVTSRQHIIGTKFSPGQGCKSVAVEGIENCMAIPRLV